MGREGGGYKEVSVAKCNLVKNGSLGCQEICVLQRLAKKASKKNHFYVGGYYSWVLHG